MITSEIEEMIAEEVSVDMAEKLVDDAIKAGRAYNHAFVFKGKEGK